MARAKNYDLIVIGSGAAGGVTAQIVANAGKKVAIIEGDKPGGSTANYDCLPTKALGVSATAYKSAKEASKYGVRAPSVSYNYPSIQGWKEQVIAATGVQDSGSAYSHEHIDYIVGWAQFTGRTSVRVNDSELTAKYFLIATGSHERLPNIRGIEDIDFITTRQLLNLKSPPKSLTIIGGGTIGVEYADMFNNLGTRVTIIESRERLLPNEDSAVGKVLQEALESRGITVFTKAIIDNAEPSLRKKKTLNIRQGDTETAVSSDEVLIAAGRLPNTNINLQAAKVRYGHTGIHVDTYLRTSNKRIFAAGDITGIARYTHIATYQAKVVAHNILNRTPVEADYRVVPRAISTWPEVAAVGISEDDARIHKLKHQVVTLPIRVVARSMITGDTTGFVKIVANPQGLILGASIVAPHAADMIHELAVAMQNYLTVHDVANTLHAFPSWSDAVRVACSHF